MTDPLHHEDGAANPDVEDDDEDDDEDGFPPVKPPRNATPAQAMLAIVLLCAFCVAIGFVLGRTL